MSATIDMAVWPAARLGEALEALAREYGLVQETEKTPVAPAAAVQKDEEAAGRWLIAAADGLGFEIEPEETTYPKLPAVLADAAPALLRLPGEDGGRFLAILKSDAKTLSVIATNRDILKLSTEAVRAAFCADAEAEVIERLDPFLDGAGLSGRRRARARQALLEEQLGETRLRGCWYLRLSPGASFYRQLKYTGVPGLLAVLVGSHAIQSGLILFAWWMVGKGALQGRFEPGWILAWALMLLTLVPFRMLAAWLQGLIAISAGGLLKRRLLHGALRLDPEEIRSQGIGQLLGRVAESELIESLALSGGFLALFAGIELIIAAAVLEAGAGGVLHVVLLAAWIGVALWFGWRYRRHLDGWGQARLHLTHDLVERMAGHRTRMAQEDPARWHEGEDQNLEGYMDRSVVLDQAAARLLTLVPRGWLVVSIAWLAIPFCSDTAGTVSLAIGLGGTLLAWQAVAKLASGLWFLGGATVAWQQVAPLFHAAGRTVHQGDPTLASIAGMDSDGEDRTLLEAKELVYRYPGRTTPVLQGLTATVKSGDRILLQGTSGSGKSTFSTILAGLRNPDGGLLTLHGLDPQTLGAAGWRRRVVAAPQFHENHVLIGTFAYNALMGKDWPPRLSDLKEAYAICDELGLGPLLERMPAEMFQMVGESGWRLSHGEKSRLYIARALLQGADVVILDESFGTLDPENMKKALLCVFKRAKTMLVVAHP